MQKIRDSLHQPRKQNATFSSCYNFQMCTGNKMELDYSHDISMSNTDLSKFLLYLYHHVRYYKGFSSSSRQI